MVSKIQSRGTCACTKDRGKGAGARGLLLLVFALAGGLAASPARAARLTRGPYLQWLTNDAVTIVWNTDRAARCSLGIWAPGEAERAISGGTGQVCAIRVDGLSSGTWYAYVPQADGLGLRAESVFSTDDPDQQQYTFLVFGDSGTGGAAQMRVRDRMLKSPADFIFHVGDMSQTSGGASEYGPQFFTPYKDLIRKLVIWPCRGNHDVRTRNGGPWRQAFYTPANNRAGTEDYYSFDFGSAHVVILDSNADTSPGSPQYLFADQDLRESTAMWNFVAFHHTIYSSGRKHGSDIATKNNLTPLFDKHGVDIVFMGHDHHYERTLPLRGGQAVKPGEGTVYVTTGGGGGLLSGAGQKWFTAYSESAHHFTGVTVLGGSLLLEMVREDGAIRDSMTLEKGPPPRCGDDLVNQPSERCDGRDDAACRGECDLDCQCPPFCGDGVVNQPAEECDGTDDESCVAGCGIECVCEEAPLVFDLEPAADTYIEQGTEATWDHGAAGHMDVDKKPRGISYLKFDLSGLMEPVEKATLRLYSINASDDGGTIYPVADSSWAEGIGNGVDGSSTGGPGLKWTDVDTNNDGILDELDDSRFVPDLTRPVVSLGAVSRGETLELDVTAAFQEGPGMYTLAISGESSDGATYASRERLVASKRPALTLELALAGSCSSDGERCADGDLCTWPDTCQGGFCLAGDTVTCAASDDCHDAGICDPESGRCSNPPGEDGTPCDDGSLCTQDDVCVAGVCAGENRVVCPASGQCHEVAVCDPATGECPSPPAKPNGTPCDDGDGCTRRDICVAGVCLGADPVVCSPLDDCHYAGVCDPPTGLCSAPLEVPDGSPCNDGDACTRTDGCVDGRCVGRDPVTCAAPDECHDAGVCDPAAGVCSYPAKRDGTPCGDGSPCSGAGICVNGVCSPGAPFDCDDHIPCTVDSCDEERGDCVHLPDDASCDDGNLCTADTCNPMVGCEYQNSGLCEPGVLDVEASADTYIEKGVEGTWDHGAAGHLDADTRPGGITYLRFDLSGLAGRVRVASLRLYCMNSSDDGGKVYSVADSSWVEGDGNGIDSSSTGGPGLKWIDVDTNGDGAVDDRDGSPYVPDFARSVASLGPVSTGQTLEVDVTPAVEGGAGVYTLAIANGSSDGVTYGSREHSRAERRPSLHVDLAPPGP